MAYLCSSFLGGHRLMHAIGAFAAMGENSDEHVIAYHSGDVDRSHATSLAAEGV